MTTSNISIKHSPISSVIARLPSVTLIALTGKDFFAHKHALAHSQRGIEFGGAKIIYDKKIDSIDEWNRRIIYDLPKYVDTTHALLIHADGYVINPYIWRDEWLQYDYIGAPWSLPQDDYSYRDVEGNVVRVGNSVSLRSKRLMEAVQQVDEGYFWEMKERYGNTNEDGFICCHNRRRLEGQGMRFAPLEIAVHFAKEHEIPENVGLETFAFHAV